MFDELFSRLRHAPAAQGLLRRVESGGALTCGGVTGSAHAFLAAWLHQEFPHRPIVLVAENLKAQEVLHQDLETWLGKGGQSSKFKVQGSKSADAPPQAPGPRPQTLLFFPAWEILPHEDKLPHADVISERLETLVRLMASGPPRVRHDSAPPVTCHLPLVTTSITALLQRTFPPAMLAARTRTLRRGERVDPLDLIEWLEDNGYDSEAQVSAKGDIALRGGIVDVFPLTSPWPVRLEFFGDELESLRTFDPVTQVSREGGELEEIVLPPAGELGVLKQLHSVVAGFSLRANAEATESKRNLKVATTEPLATLLDYLPDDSIVILCEPETIERHAEEYGELVPTNDPFFASWEELRGELLRRKLTVLALMEDEHGSAGVYPARSEETSSRRLDTCAPTGPAVPDPSPVTRHLSPLLSSLEPFRPISDHMPEQEIALAQRQAFFHQLASWLRQGFAVHVVCNNDGEAQRFQEVWAEMAKSPERGLMNPQGRSADAHVRDAALQGIVLGTLSRGFLCEAAKFVVVTDAEVFGRYKVQRPRRMKSAHAIAARSALDIDFAELEEGDYVVHLQHGIGRFKGLKVLPTNKPGRERHHLDPEALRPEGNAPTPGSSRREEAPSKPTQNSQSLLTSAATRVEEGIECLVLEYAPSDTDREPPKLYVPVTEAHLISKYVGAGKMRPPLNTLGGKRWEKTKQQAERAVRDVAADLLAIQAKRATQPGHAFGPDTPWQREFESSFLYEETADQLRAIGEAKHDLEIAKPMDRLICGDVGFGKTEIAIRAAFKAVMGGKQVAILVPTTVLAQQHYNTFRERMADYPVRVELLSRFRTRKEQLHVVEQLAAGAVDIVIGTHRLVQSDVTFKDLGLVVIDEEQRFGVMHKEKFKLLRTHVDVLTLSATPIPRTLYLALTGARDMSTIQTPPQDRLPVETIVEHYDERVIRDAILRELGRGGQVFFLHNRVTTIEAMRSKLQLLVPHARVVVGHGQMSGDELEDVMTKFVNGEADVLLSTTIIESGLDIPNANTLIIDRADRFGLSQLYQLRGRVGRYKHQAFAYLLLPRHARLLTDVRKRMSAIKQYAQLGSGFKIAMRDLEIRGAGNLLGAQQSGHITAVGFELYCNLLKQSVAALKGEKVKQRTNAALRLDFLAMNPVAEEPDVLCAPYSVPEAEGHRTPSRNTQHATRSTPSISVPRDGGVWIQESRREREEEVVEVKKGGAFLPPTYIAEPQHRIEAYRKLAQAETKADVDALARELKDRYGKPPKPVELLLVATELKLLAGERGLDAIETKAGKLMLHRRGDYIQLGGKFPRLTKTEPLAVLKEIKKLLLSL
ncbi:MAG: transcription-repair coupling factor (superfamily II helicase) [Limisphaerales bacterium]|nr:MAG: transcription-repair coupling factor (superfamily II helicase) [Limisphaerales bacterium]KAG0507493.1 MAG: transcription-repair coupling factor (superfamily II helicase) [Limisphaerales bacterium]TXT50708.1 MAG: transcription-repair coupling factor (superfamily II helicase) [Limisphaerales bacterium]